MAKKTSKASTSTSGNITPTQSSSAETKRFDGDLQKDVSDYHIQASDWSYARNAINNSNRGDLGMLGNEPANKFCISAPYTIIGFIHLDHDKWTIFSTDNTNSEIGYFEESTCTYAKIVNDPCLNFSTEHLIYGVSREDFECNHVIYWADGFNVDRYLRIGDITNAPYQDPWPGVPYGCIPPNPSNPQNCNPCVFQIPLQLNCDLIRLETLMRPICFNVSKSALGGELLNGSYFVTGAYTVDGMKVTDYFTPSNVQPLFDHSGVGGSLDITIEEIDTQNFDEFELVVISVIAQQTVAKKLGVYSTRQSVITIDIIDNQLPSVPLQEIPVSNVIYEKSEALYNVNNYLLRVSPTSRFNVNYQPLANQIRVKWQSVEYPEIYYKNGGNNTGYMRDEVYAFFIRWIYNTGERSASFHIPGRPQFSSDTDPYNNDDAIELQLGISASNLERWQVENTAVMLGGFTPYTLCDGGVVLSEGYMGYWESTELYSDTKPEIWDSSAHPWSEINGALPYGSTALTDYDLCGKAIRHHRFPDNDLDTTVSHWRQASSNTSDTNYIRIMGVKFENIRPPRDNQGNIVPGVIGYEILRGSRKNNRSVIAKGMINNMVEYNLNIEGSTQTGLFQNYPYNDLQGDKFLSKTQTRTDGFNVTSPLGYTPFGPDSYKQHLLSFHSPETNFTNPYLSPIELKTYQDISGLAKMRYQYPSKHPKHVFPKDLALFMALFGGIGTALLATKGNKKTKKKLGSSTTVSSTGVFAGLAGVGSWPNPLIYIPAATAAAANTTATTGLKLAYDVAPISLLEAIIGGNDQSAGALYALQALAQGLSNASALHGEQNVPELESEYGKNDYIPLALNVVMPFLGGSLPTFVYYLTQAADEIYKIIENASRPQQHALQMISNCLYDDYTPRVAGQRRRIIRNSGYVDNQLQDFGTKYKINNLYRGRFVALELASSGGGWSFSPPALTDETRFDTRLQDLSGGQQRYRNPEVSFTKPSSSYYSALKQRLRNQYGQIETITQLPISCMVRICGAGNGQRQYRYQDGFNLGSVYEEGRGPSPVPLNAPLLCDGNKITNPQFDNGIIGVPDFTDWTSSPNPSWTATGVLGNTVAFNNGSALLVTPDIYPELIQYFPTPLPNNRLFLLSFNVPILATGYSIEVYLGSNTLTPSLVLSSPGSYSTPVVPASFTPPSGVLDSIRFRSVSALTPKRITATLPSSVQPTNEPWQCCASGNNRVWFVHALSNAVNNINNEINTSQLFFESCPDGFTPALYNQTSLSYISKLTCTSLLTYNLGLSAAICDSFYSSPSVFQIQLRKLTCCDRAGLTPGPPCPTGCSSPCPTCNPAYGEFVADITPGSVPVTGSPVFYTYSGSIQINNPDPSDKYIIFLSVINVQHSWNGGDIILDTCIIQEPVAITDICLTLPESGAGYGCTDSSASNYDPTATVDNGTCIYYGCTDPNASNYCSFCTPCPNDSADCECIYNNTEPGGPPALAGPCIQDCHPVVNDPISYNSSVMFGGDIYIGRYTEKNSFFYFFDWMYGQPDRYEWDYQKYRLISYPTYWFNSGGMTATESVESAYQALIDVGNWGNGMFANVVNPSDFHCFDRPSAQFGFVIKRGYMYLFNSGVRDFFVESEYNVDLRDFGDDVTQRHYNAVGRDSYTDTSAMFEAGVIKAGNYYKYDNSLSIAKIWYSYVGWGNVYPRYYDPKVAETCYQYRPNRIIYSLPVDTETVRDNWRIFLTNNYKDFLSKVTAVKQINKSGAVILFEFDSPVMFQGTDQLQTDLGTKLTIGDGGLFSQPMQSLMNADRPYEYGSCQNRLSVINTPVGTFWISQNQGKIFQLSSGLTEITIANLKWWFAQFMPYQLTKYFPEYDLIDNPVAGIGCQAIYDNTNNLVYFTKKDYKPVLKSDGTPKVSYDSDKKKFYINVGTAQVYVEFSNPQYFESASWTVSYDVKTKGWVSFHDWHPDLVAPGKNTFMTTKDDSLWIHNQRCDLYANYYGINYPFEVEYMVNTMQTVNTLRSIEYQLEVYKYKYDNCYDRFHVLDYNFDEAVIYNTEQCSGLLKLNLTPKNNAPLLTQYPQINPTNIQILYSKEENKYRFNQFWDTTKDRGEFDWIINNNSNPPIPGDLDYPPVPTNAVPGGSGPGTFRQQTIWNTQPNGYIKTLNGVNLTYNKSQLERKKFRHYTTSVLLRRKVSGNKKMLVSFTNNKNLLSPR